MMQAAQHYYPFTVYEAAQRLLAAKRAADVLEQAAAGGETNFPPPKKRRRRSSNNAIVVGNKRAPVRRQVRIEQPSDFVLRTYKEANPQWESHMQTTKTKFQEPTQELMDAYTQEKLMAVRNGDLAALQALHADGTDLECCNKYGESIIHLACRRGLTDIVKFLVDQAGVSLYHSDDFDRTPMHDACWTPEPNLPLMEYLLQKCPDQVVLKDSRGFTPFDYIRSCHSTQWLTFLKEHSNLLHLNRPKEEVCR